MVVLFRSIDSQSHLLLRLVRANALELTLVLDLAHAGLTGRSQETDFFRADVARFLDSLRAFAVSHQGEATLESFDLPGITLRVWPIDQARHAGLEISLEYGQTLGNGFYDNQINVAFELDPSRWEELLTDLQAMLDA